MLAELRLAQEPDYRGVAGTVGERYEGISRQ